MVTAMILTVAFSVWGCAAGANVPGSPSGIQAVVTVSEVNANRESFVGKPIGVRGRIVVEELQSAGAGPCNVATGVGCNPVALTRLHLVDPDSANTETNRLDLYRQTSSGYEPVSCRILGVGSYDCGAYVPGSLMVVDGTFTKYAEPVQQVIQPDGRAVVIRSQDIYFLAVR
jgi:hypothetical protein